MTTATATRDSALKPGTQQQRALTFERAKVDTASRTIELAFASETPVDRWWGQEILDCTPGAVRLARMASGGPLLADHDPRDVIGVIESVRVDADRVVRATVRFGKSARAEEVWQDVVDGIRRNVSVGYVIHRAQLVETSDDGDDDVYRVTDWEPHEVSIVAVPADPAVGIGRSADDPRSPASPPGLTASAPTPPAPAPAQEHRTMNTAIEAPAPAPAPAATPAAPALNTSADAAASRNAERARVREMLAIGDQFERWGGKALALAAIDAGDSVDALRAKVMNAVTAGQTAPPSDLGMERGQVQRYSVLRAVRAMVERNWALAPLEHEAHQAICKRAGIPEAPHGGFYMPADVQRAPVEKRDLTVGTAANGGYLVATDNLASSFIELLRARAVVARMGARFLSGLVGNVTIPKQTGAATGYWLANEATAITESQQTIGQLALSPKTVGAYTELSRLLMMQSDPSADALVREDLAKVIALAIDLAALEGSGASGQPTGISATGGIGSVSGTTLGLAGIVEFQTDLAAANALTPGAGYITTPAVAGLLKQRQRFSSTDTPLWVGNVLDGNIEGFRATTTTQLTAASMIFGDYSQVVIAEWGMLELALNPFANFTAAITGIRAMQSVDIGIRQASAFSRATSIT